MAIFCYTFFHIPFVENRSVSALKSAMVFGLKEEEIKQGISINYTYRHEANPLNVTTDRARVSETDFLTFLSLFTSRNSKPFRRVHERGALLDWSRDVSPRYFFPWNHRYTRDEGGVHVDGSVRSVSFSLLARRSTPREKRAELKAERKRSGVFTPLPASGCTCVAVSGSRRSGIINVPGESSRSVEIDLLDRVSREGQVHCKPNRYVHEAYTCATMRIRVQHPRER